VNRLYLILSLVVAFFVVGVLALFLLGPASPYGALSAALAEGPAKDVASQFLEDLGKDRTEEAYGRTSNAYQGFQSIDDFRVMAAAHPAFRNARHTDWQTRERTHNQVTFKAVLAGPRGAFDVMVEVTSKEGTGWKVNRLAVWPREPAAK
jgi:hypothetical protein